MSHESRTSPCPDFDPLDVVALTMIEGYGAATVRAHLARIRAEARSIDDGFPAGVFSAARDDARRAFGAASRIGARCILDGEDDYPDALHALEHPPVVLWTLGNVGILHDRPRVSIVGTRDSTQYGERVTRKIASAFARAGALVVSGMALGIDAAAHRSAMEAGGATAAVLGTGVDVPYPVRHRALHRQIAETGAVVSESPPGTQAGPGCFPRRNRIIAALGAATIVVEAPARSGALNTAEHVRGIDRELAVIPGPIDSPVSLGSNGLLRDGAHPITCVADALALLHLSDFVKPTAAPESPSERAVWTALARPAASFDIMCARCNLPARVCVETFTALEIRGIVECTLTGELRRR